MIVKLIRDRTKIATGSMCTVNSLAGKHLALCNKLHEDAAEIARDADCPYEYADLFETVFELMRINHVPWNLVEKALLSKRKDRGAFRRGMIWTKDVPESPSWPLK